MIISWKERKLRNERDLQRVLIECKDRKEFEQAIMHTVRAWGTERTIATLAKALYGYDDPVTYFSTIRIVKQCIE